MFLIEQLQSKKVLQLAKIFRLKNMQTSVALVISVRGSPIHTRADIEDWLES